MGPLGSLDPPLLGWQAALGQVLCPEQLRGALFSSHPTLELIRQYRAWEMSTCADTFPGRTGLACSPVFQ